jgi:D-alanyl-D-alanine carboxypeptidase
VFENKCFILKNLINAGCKVTYCCGSSRRKARTTKKNTMKKILLVAALALGSLVSAQDLNTAKLDSLLDAIESNNKGMGSLAVSHAGKLIYTRAIGFSAMLPAGNTAAEEATKYRIGSITKMFTATLVFQAIEAGKLKLDTKLSTYFPKLPNAKKITIAQLLGHRSGLHNFTDDSAYGTYMTVPKTQEEMLAIIAKTPADFEPDAKAAYSNSNYVVLGMILEKVCKQSYGAILDAQIVSKLGLKNTQLGSADADPRKKESRSFEWIDGIWEATPQTAMSIPLGAGAILSTPSDLTEFIDALFAGRLVSQASLSEMKRMQDGYGKGMFEYPLTSVGKIGYGHSGGIDGFSSMLLTIPQDQLTVAYCSNGGGYPIDEILEAVLKDFYGKPYYLPVFKNLAITPEELELYKGVYASEEMPLKITVTVNSKALKAQATGQAAFPLEATDVHEFRFDQAGIVMRFDPWQNTMVLEQGGGVYHFKRL